MATQSAASTSSLDHELVDQTYRLATVEENQPFQNLYGVGIFGANIEDVILEFRAEDTFFTFSLPENIKLAREEGHRLRSLEPRSSTGSRNPFPSAKLGVVARQGVKPPVIFFGLCDCSFCKGSVDADPLKLTSIDVDFRLTFGTSVFKMEEFDFHPSCKEEYNMGSPLAHNLNNVVYYTIGCTSCNSSVFQDFITHIRSNRVPERNETKDITTAITLISIAATNASLDKNHETLERLLKDDAFMDFKLISSQTGEGYKCHKSVLSVQSEELKRIILRKQEEHEPKNTRDKLYLNEHKTTILAFLNWIYVKNERVISAHYGIALGLLRLGHEYHLPKLVAATAKVLTELIKSTDPEIDISKSLWKLYKFVRLVDKIDVVVRLKIAIVKRLGKIMAKKKLEKVRATATEEMTALNDGKPVCPVLANDFIMELLDLGKFDE